MSLAYCRNGLGDAARERPGRRLGAAVKRRESGGGRINFESARARLCLSFRSRPRRPPRPRRTRDCADPARFRGSRSVAGLAALEDAKLKLDADTAPRTALIFAVSNGGVIYTKRFYDEIVESGSQAASPLLFPETVFNAPASHLAAILGITGASYTLVGDGAVGILALKMADDLMRNDMLDHCLVVGAEEADWLLCDAYRKWRLLRSTPPIEPFGTPPRGTVLSEGAGAILLSRDGPIQLERIAAGTNFRKQSEAGDAVDKVFVGAL